MMDIMFLLAMIFVFMMAVAAPLMLILSEVTKIRKLLEKAGRKP